MVRSEFSLSLESIRVAARGMSEPEEYFHGRSPKHPLILPTNILLFARHKSDILTSGRSERDGFQHHHRFMLVAALSGSGNICLDAEKVMLRAGEALLLCPFQFHSYHDVLPEQICWLFCTFEMPDTSLLEVLRNSPRRMGAGRVLALRSLVEAWRKNAPVHQLQLQLTDFLLQLTDAPDCRHRTDSDSCNAKFLAKINHALIPRLDRPLGLKRLAKEEGCSESYLRKTFRELTGMSLGKHIRRLRIQRACSLLHQSMLPIGEIASRCGFDSVYSFSRAFRQATTYSPRQYRARMVGE